MPTEAEWEYASGGGSSNRTKWAGTNSESELENYAWYSGNARSKTHPVGGKKPNSIGLYDMSGNVWEWCSDWYVAYDRQSQTNPIGPTLGSYRVNRGGSWGNYARNCRTALRGNLNPGISSYYMGFRLVLDSR